jgi:hypothetical protein
MSCTWDQVTEWYEIWDGINWDEIGIGKTNEKELDGPLDGKSKIVDLIHFNPDESNRDNFDKRRAYCHLLLEKNWQSLKKWGKNDPHFINSDQVTSIHITIYISRRKIIATKSQV